MATKKTTKKPEKKAAAPLRDSIGRVYGAKLYSATVSHAEARTLMSKHGFRLEGKTDTVAHVWADRTAYDSYTSKA